MAKELQDKEIKEILNEVVSGNSASFNKIIMCFEKHVFSLSLRLLKHREEAEEVAQDAFVKAFLQVKTFKGKSRFSTWLYRITFNECMNRIRKNRKDFVVVNESAEGLEIENNADLWECLKHSERSFYLLKAIDKLNEEEQLMIMLYYQHERTIQEIEAITGIAQNTIKVKLFRSRQKLEKILLAMLPQEAKDLY